MGISTYLQVHFLAIIIWYPTMKRSIKATIMAVLGITTFAGVSMISVKVNQQIATIPAQVPTLNATIATTNSSYNNLQEPTINAKVPSNKSYLSPDFGSNTQYSTLFQSPITEPSKPFQLSFGGEAAEARLPKIKVPVNMPDGKKIWVWADKTVTGLGLADAAWRVVSFFGGKSENVYFIIANEVPIEWGEAWHLCNRQYNSKLVWQNNLKTCIKR
jgi:outer membrane murein-binding lipoprotein Lpp